MFVPDLFNNVRRLCSIPNSPEYRAWRVMSRMSGGRYLVKHIRTGQCRSVAHADMHNLY